MMTRRPGVSLPELIIALFAVNEGLTEVVRGSLTGSVIGNLLLVLGFSLVSLPMFALAGQVAWREGLALAAGGLVGGWLASSRVPSLVGSRDPAGKAWNALAPELSSGLAEEAGLAAAYEVDLWGGISADVSGARADFRTTQYDEVAAELSINGAVASSWFQWLALQQRISSVEENIRIAERIAQIVQARYDNGVATAADVSRQKTNLLSQQSSLLPLQLQARQTRSALALLVGESPLNFAVQANERLLDLMVPEVAEGIPADVLTRRPDLAAAEAQLQAADANVAAARAALLPGLQLTASAARSSAALFSLSPPADSLNWSVGLAQTLFNGGRLRNQVKLSESQRVALVEQYRKAILIALQEVADAFDRQAISMIQEENQNAILAEAERTLRLTEVRYKEGSEDLLSLLEAQRTVFQARDQLVQQRQARLEAAVDLYLALGGGWQN